MKVRFTIFIIFLFALLEAKAQITVSQAGNVAQWVQNVLIGPGITVSNVTYTGSPLAIGTFTTGINATNLGFPAGIILASGKASDAQGPNNSGSITTAFMTAGDAHLAALINTPVSNIKDAAVLEFDFIPVSDTVRFRYAFGSDEYPEFVNSSFNDVFGFFVSGISPYGGFYSNKNIALIPNTTTPVSINNVNNGTANAGPCTNCTYYQNNVGGTWIQYDGMTVVLTAWIKVIPCFTYHIKLAIADVGDNSYDSGVFLEANSFMSNSVVIDQKTSNTIDTSAIEGCNDAIVTFRLPNPISTPTIINYLPLGTATNGVDYSLIPYQITIPAGQDSVNLIIHPILDGVAEPTELVKLIVNTSACTYDTVYIYIKDNNKTMPVLPNDTVLCDNSTISIPVITTGGYSPYSYLWSTGDTTQTISITPAITTQYIVTVSDLCSNDSTVSMWVNVSKPIFSIYNDTVCLKETANLFVVPNMPLSYDWSNGSNSNNINVTPSITTSYDVRITDSLGCFIDTNAVAFVNPLPVLITSPDISICHGDNTTLTVQGGYTYLWNTGSVDSVLNIIPNNTSIYTVTSKTEFGCEADTSILVTVVPDPMAIITTTIDTLCKGSIATLTASGGDTYLWSTGSNSSTISIQPTQTTNYSVIASYSIAGISLICSDTAYFSQPVKRCNRFYVPSAFTPNDDGLNDYFGAEGVFTNIENYQIFIFDRWGKQVYYNNDVFAPWNGKINNEFALGGVYSYKIIIQESFSEEYVLTGTVHLIR